jgi:hypothetical protein
MQTWKKRQMDSNLVDPSICANPRIKAKISGQKNQTLLKEKKVGNIVMMLRILKNQAFWNRNSQRWWGQGGGVHVPQ